MFNYSIDKKIGLIIKNFKRKKRKNSDPWIYDSDLNKIIKKFVKMEGENEYNKS